MSTNTLRFEDGAVQFRQRLAVSILSQRPLLIKNIRSDALEPGLRPYEISFLRLLDQISNGTRIEINATGTQLRFAPGILTGGEVEHECPVGSDEDKNQDNDDSLAKYRSIGWYLEGILPLAPFGKHDLTVIWTGITDGTCYNQDDPSVDYFKASALPLLGHFGITASDDALESNTGPEISILRRGASPLGGGQVKFHCPLVRKLEQPIDWTDVGKIKRIRGNAVSCTLVSSSSTARVAYAAKGVLQRLLPDVWIHTDVHTRKQHQCGSSPALNVHLTAQSTTGVIMTVEDGLKHRELPEDLGKRVASKLLQEVQYGGCVDSDLQSLALLYMCLTPEDASRLRIGRLTPFTIEALRLYKLAWGVE
eukprot:CAMPEP_0198149626 /NCGR_PEP_ID=MMETSP1443-20131203/47490_1 /TAXON_ID=186043 /ORGANISM="Entomoneis sp., Strain CCMP2396" /LENGTH=364 /DNA_ID=CAMNT_0043814721 /DNA_START=86 /DNA_END=1177 /DNA_ORIENTATION=-